jgi:hypothetical protein
VSDASDLEGNGWRQGSLLKPADFSQIIEGTSASVSESSELIIISQSCDLAQLADKEPFVEVLPAVPVARKDGNFSFNKNPRILHLAMSVRTNDRAVVETVTLEARAFDKLIIPKRRFYGLSPDGNKTFAQTELEAFVHWLAARYSRPALPSAFNAALSVSDPNAKKRKKLAKSVSAHASGIYVEIHPDREISAGESYRVNLLGLLLPTAEAHLPEVKREIEGLGELMRTAGMDVTVATHLENEVSVAVLKRFRRFYFDDVSYKEDGPLPPDVR